MLKLEFKGGEIREIPNELTEMSIDQWLKVSNILSDKTNGFANKFYKILGEFGVEEELLDQITDQQEMKKIFLKVKFKADDIELKKEITIGDGVYEYQPFIGKIYRFIENEMTSEKPNYNKVAAYKYKLKGQDMSEHISTTKDRTKKIEEHLTAADIVPVIKEAIKEVNVFIS